MKPANKASSVSDQIYEQLRSDILNGVFEPGEVLRQEEMARRSNASRVPLREAMARLHSEGLLVRRPRRGYAVILLDQSDIVEIFDLRMVLEEHACYLAARSRTAEDIVEVGAMLATMERMDTNSVNGFELWSQINYRFHNRIIESTRRVRLSRIAVTLRDSVEAYVRLEAAITGQVYVAEDEHRQIFDAYRAGDATGLAHLARAHVEGTARRLLDGLRKAGRSGDGSTLSPYHRLLASAGVNRVASSSDRPSSV